MPTYQLTILTPEGKAFESDVHSIIAHGLEGFFGVLAHHTPMIAAIRLGTLTITVGEEVSYFVLGEGILEVSGEGVSILADTAESVENEDRAVARAKEIAVQLAATTAA